MVTLNAPKYRITSAMKYLLVKYSFCSLIWKAEQVLEVVIVTPIAIILVSVVDTKKSLQFSLGTTLTMAEASAMVQPYMIGLHHGARLYGVKSGFV